VSCTGLPVREDPRRFHLILPIPVLLHLTGSVLDEDVPFGNTVLHANTWPPPGCSALCALRAAGCGLREAEAIGQEGTRRR
jgi:hypothetical protein